jgi:glycosyltransferase involved in cell wall biosynthesis
MISNMYPSAAEPGYGSFVQRQEERLTSRHGVEIRIICSQQRGGGKANVTKYAALLGKTLMATAGGGYDLVHAHYLLPVAAFALIPAIVRRKPLVITAHGTDIYTGTWRGWKKFITMALRRACRIIVVSEFLGERLVENFDVTPEDGRGLVIANMGVDTDKFTPGETAAVKSAQGLPSEVVHLLFVGNFVEQKGVTDLARALVDLDGRGVRFQATLLGHGPEMTDVLDIVEPLGDIVCIREVVSHDALIDVFRSADLFVLPSRREGVGLLVCLEALACGVPVAASRAGGLPEIVHDGVNGVTFQPGDPIAIADTLQRLIEHPEERARLAASARESALPYSEDSQAEKVLRVYEECVRG